MSSKNIHLEAFMERRACTAKWNQINKRVLLAWTNRTFLLL